MMVIIHGEDEVKIHQYLASVLDSYRAKNISISRTDAKGLSISDLETLVGTDELFASQKVVVIDRIHALPKSKQKDLLLSWLAEFKSPTTDVVLVEHKILTPTQLKKFGSADVQLFKLPSALFSFLETIGTQPAHKSVTLFHQVLENQEAEQVFVMMIRQFRQLLQYRSDRVYLGPPFGRAKIQKQSEKFETERLLSLYNRLLHIDLGQKTSTSVLSLTQEIDLFLLEL
ncbi:hypothetical protein KBD71_01605 [Candidatus Woesebacteria bacterium]|nr:hypothetical protein [Candidatus Woesebacteria bacterium]